MIQRVQSLYLLVIVLALIVMFFVPLAAFTTETETVFWQLSGYQNADVLTGQPMPPASVPAIVAAVLGLGALLTVFLYKNRKFQIRMCRNILIVSVLFIASIFFVVDKTSNLDVVNGYAYLYGTYLSLVVPVMIYLAIGAIRRDERRVRAADRLR